MLFYVSVGTTAESTASYRTAVPAWSADRNAGGTCRATNPEGGTADTKSAAIDTFGMPGELREYRSPNGHNVIPGEEALTGRLCQKPTEHTGTASTATGSSAVTYIVPPNPIIMRGGHRSDRVVTQSLHSAPMWECMCAESGAWSDHRHDTNVSRSFAGRTEALKAKSTSGPNALNVQDSLINPKERNRISPGALSVLPGNRFPGIRGGQSPVILSSDRHNTNVSRKFCRQDGSP